MRRYFRMLGSLLFSSEKQNHASGSTFTGLLGWQNHSFQAGPVTAVDLVNHWESVFEKNRIPEARESSEYIVSHVLGAKTFQSLNQRVDCCSTPLTAIQLTRIQELSTLRLQRMPVQYIFGEWDFQDLTLKMVPPVFIPRPETEELVNLVLKEKSLKNMESMEAAPSFHQLPDFPTGPLILEVGCGSGAISLSLLSKLPQSRVIAVDKSEAAVRLTRENAQRLHLQDRIRIIHLDISSRMNWQQLIPWGPVDLVVSNPPYVFQSDMAHLAAEILRSVFLEVDPRHPELVGNWLPSQPDLFLSLSATHTDFCGKPRFLHIQKMVSNSSSSTQDFSVTPSFQLFGVLS
ncbi:MTRF1L release factor glutamine methyltransferase isoform X2 [Tachyglossus aculeatus]|uniref:MTRF1L release factor glutamine methyltransferase isoform X2 n=1 Tax=Tachyglossus aculeatus TaxID=9261 RepID=UPI0018F5FE72|nr:MTRF1L release factor glutamine methyltransferase isoform X2 [Tachyglossus aculeatus]